MRNVRRSLRAAGIVPPDGVQKIVLVRDAGAEDNHHAESAAPRDTSVDHTLDHQLAAAQDADEQVNLLDDKSQPPPK